MRGVHAKRAVLILAVVVLAVEGYYVYQFYDTSYSPTAPGMRASETKAETTAEPEKTTPGGSTVASVGEEAAAEQKDDTSKQDQADADRSADAAKRAEAEYVGAVEDIQTNAVETFRNSHEKLLRYDSLSAADVEGMKANEAALQGMADRAADLAPPQKHEEQHDVFVSAIDQLHEASRLAHGMAADPVSAAELGFDEYDGQVNEASALLQRSNGLLGKDYETIEDIREISPEF